MVVIVVVCVAGAFLLGLVVGLRSEAGKPASAQEPASAIPPGGIVGGPAEGTPPVPLEPEPEEAVLAGPVEPVEPAAPAASAASPAAPPLDWRGLLAQGEGGVEALEAELSQRSGQESAAVLAALAAALPAEPLPMKLRIARALVKISGRDGIAAVAAALPGCEPMQERAALAGLLAASGADGIGALAGLLSDERAVVSAALALASLDPDQLPEGVWESLRTKGAVALAQALPGLAGEELLAAARALGRIGAHSAVPELVALLARRGEEEARRAASEALVQLGDAATGDAVFVVFVAGPAEDTRIWAARTLLGLAKAGKWSPSRTQREALASTLASLASAGSEEVRADAQRLAEELAAVRAR